MACNCLNTTRNNSSISLSKSIITVDATISPDTSTNYAAGDSVGGLLSWDCALGLAGGSATVKQIQLIEVASSTVNKYGLDLIFLGSGNYSIADNAPFVAGTAGLVTDNHLCGHVVITASTDYYTIPGTTTRAEALKTSKDFGELKVFGSAMLSTSATASQKIYGYLLWTGTGAHYSSGAQLIVRVTFERD